MAGESVGDEEPDLSNPCRCTWVFADLARWSGFPAGSGRNRLWVVLGLVIRVGFGDSYGLELTGLFVSIV